MAGLTANNPYDGVTNTTGTAQQITNYLADTTEERILHYVNADPNRTPTFSLFARPDYFLSTGSPTCPTTPPSGQFATSNPCVTINPRFAWNHGDYAAEINSTWLGLAGPGVLNKRIDGFGPADGPSSAGPNSGQGTVPGVNNPGTWADHTDIRPTMLALAGVHDDYQSDGRVLVEDMTSAATPADLSSPFAVPLMACYKQLNSSVGQFGTDTLKADTAAVESGTASQDANYVAFQSGLTGLADVRDLVATATKGLLNDATAGKATIGPYNGGILTLVCGAILSGAHAVAGNA